MVVRVGEVEGEGVVDSVEVGVREIEVEAVGVGVSEGLGVRNGV